MSRSISESAIDSLSRREHSVFELRRKLKQKGFDESDIEALLQQLIEKKLLSDERFSESYINMRKRRGYGPVRITQELRERGVEDAVFEALLDRNNAEWREIMQQQYIKKYRNKDAEDYAEKTRRAKYLQSRGFPLDWVFKLNSINEYDY